VNNGGRVHATVSLVGTCNKVLHLTPINHRPDPAAPTGKTGQDAKSNIIHVATVNSVHAKETREEGAE